MIDKRWVLKNSPDPKVIDHLSTAINITTPLATILTQRGIKDYDSAKAFFRPTMDMLHDPFLMEDMEKACIRIETAIAKNEKVLIYGDYDVDGTTSVALFFNFLHSFYTQCDFYIPDRYKEGYGVSLQGIEWAEANDFTLIITLDCGIKSGKLVDIASEKGIDFIICDHHLPGDILPSALAILDPKRNECNYPYKELSGCGIGFKLIQGFTMRNPQYQIDPAQFLDLVVVSIASDIVPITGENRILAYFGLKRLASNPRPGLKALIRLAGINKKITITGIVFGLAPRINAAGRIAHAHASVNLLLAQSEEEAYHFAKQLNIKNEERRDFDSNITEEALAMIEAKELTNAKTTVLFKNDWHKGVIGIVASRCIEHYHRPTIILTESNNKATGSARSVPGFNVYSAIETCSDLLDEYGGHKYAAGLSMPLDKIGAFQQKFESVVANSIPKELLIPQIEIDIKLDLDKITKNFYNVLKQIAPFGPGNLHPIFLTESVNLASSLKVMKERHLKFYVQQAGGKKKIEAIGFGLSDKSDLVKSGKPFKIVYSIEQNEFQGITSLQLNIKDIK